MQVANVLAIIVENDPEVSVQTICSWLLVSSSCKSAMERCRGSCSTFLAMPKLAELLAGIGYEGVELCAQWFANYAGLVAHIEYYCDTSEKLPELHLVQQHFAAKLLTALEHKQGLPLALKSFRTNCFPDPEMVRLLEYTLVKDLTIYDLVKAADLGQSTVDVPPGVMEALGHLTTLGALEISCRPDAVSSAELVHVEGLAHALQQLQNLTFLEVSVDVSAFEPSDASKLPASLRCLNVTFCAGEDGADVVELSHLTALQQLTWRRVWNSSDAPLRVTLPKQLRDAHIKSPLPPLTHPAEIYSLKVELSTNRDMGELPDLLQSCSPKSLALTFGRGVDGSVAFTQSGLQQAASALGCVSGLLSLSVEPFEIRRVLKSSDRYQSLLSGVSWCEPLAKLQHLQQLRFDYEMPFAQADLMHLTALTSLVKLRLMDSGSAGLNDVSAVALAQQLTKLEALTLVGRGMSSAALLPAVSSLTRLASLYLEGGIHFRVSDAELWMLRHLKKLSVLGLHAAAYGADTLHALGDVLPNLYPQYVGCVIRLPALFDNAK